MQAFQGLYAEQPLSQKQNSMITSEVGESTGLDVFSNNCSPLKMSFALV